MSYKSIDMEALNSVAVNGHLMGLDLREATSKANNKPFRSMTATVRVAQTYGDRDKEISEIPLSFIAMKYKNNGENNSLYKNLGDYANNYIPAQRGGIDNATRVNINGYKGNGRLTENLYADTRNPENVISSFNINATFLNESTMTSINPYEYATFNVEIFILNLVREKSPTGEETGRLKIRGGIVGWHRRFDCFTFFVEDPVAVDIIERKYHENDTAHFVGRIRYTSQVEESKVESSWGEDIPTTTTRKKHELIITGPGKGDEDGPLEEERSYDPDEIRQLMADRTERIEQAKIDAQHRKTKNKKPAIASMSAAPMAYNPVAASSAVSYDWEE